MLRFTDKHRAFVRHRGRRQQHFWDFLALCGAGAEGASADDATLYDWGKILIRIEVKRLEATLRHAGEEEEERSLIIDLKRHARPAVAWSRHGSPVPRWT